MLKRMNMIVHTLARMTISYASYCIK